MEHIKVCKVEKVELQLKDKFLNGTLHLTPYHLIFSPDGESEANDDVWVTYSLIASVESLPITENKTYPLKIKCHNFLFFTLTFTDREKVLDAFESIKKLTCKDSITSLYAFHFIPSSQLTVDREAGWKVYDPVVEFKRQGVEVSNKNWRFTSINKDYNLCSTYPDLLVVPSSISDSVLNYAKNYRSKGRIPVLSYVYKNQFTITRSSQPLLGLKQNRSIQDEKLVQAIFSSSSTAVENLIIDARPTANAMANVAIGMGSENMDFYPNSKKAYMGIENIHVVRDSLNKLVEGIDLGGERVINPVQLNRSNWLKHIKSILDATLTIVNTITKLNSHVLVHCSDGWDRTSQLTSLPMLCLDPYYRTLKGFAVLIEKEYVSFGHKFLSRSGHLSKNKIFADNSALNINHHQPNLLTSMQNRLLQYSSSKPSQDKETCPIFHQFLDCVYQLCLQYPTAFEFDEKLLVYLHTEVYACKYGNFLHDSQLERKNCTGLKTQTYSIWSKLLTNKDNYFTNPAYDPNMDQVLTPITKNLLYWSNLLGRMHEDLNSTPGLLDLEGDSINVSQLINRLVEATLNGGDSSNQNAETSLTPDNEIEAENETPQEPEEQIENETVESLEQCLEIQPDKGLQLALPQTDQELQSATPITSPKLSDLTLEINPIKSPLSPPKEIPASVTIPAKPYDFSRLAHPLATLD